MLFTAHDLHEAPWGFGQQLDQLIQGGLVGDAVLLPEPLSQPLPVVGRGAATWKVVLRRAGAPVHEVMRPASEPSVIAAGAELVARLNQLGQRPAPRSDPLAEYKRKRDFSRTQEPSPSSAASVRSRPSPASAPYHRQTRD